MTAKVKERPTAKAAYEADYYTWVSEQVALLRAGRLSEIDAEHIAEELFDMGKSELSRLEGSLRVLIMHMLKWDQQAEHRTLSWVYSIREQRRRIVRLLAQNPGLKAKRAEAVAAVYPTSRDWAAHETNLAVDDFPTDCPYEWDELLDRPYETDSVPPRR